jgi:bifunctional UDP-N-acetylglucosamine pyrophosphorylase/glucosamine-1-phosphate N-acetyltransferase
MILNQRKEEVIAATRQWHLNYCEAPVLNGTGGALLAAKLLVRQYDGDAVIITMGDVPFVRRETYRSMLRRLSLIDMVVLGFAPAEKQQYGVIKIQNERVRKIIEWKYWQRFTSEAQAALTFCNASIYAVRREALERYFPVLANRARIVHKMIDGRLVECIHCEDEFEHVGGDDPSILERAQILFVKSRY